MRIKTGYFAVCLIPVALALSFGVIAWSQQPTVTKFDGIFASYSLTSSIVNEFGDIIGSDYKYVYVAESMGSGGTQWRLNFTLRKILNGMPQKQVQLTGSGPIPDSCVTLNKPIGKNLALYVDVPALPTSGDMAFKGSKTFMPPGSPDPAIDMDFGLIQLKWLWTNDLWNRSEGHSVLDFGTYWQHQQGTTEQNAALVWGSLFGFEILPVETGYPPGRIGQTKSIVITHPK